MPKKSKISRKNCEQVQGCHGERSANCHDEEAFKDDAAIYSQPLTFCNTFTN